MSGFIFPDPQTCAMLLIDMQEKLLAAMNPSECAAVVKRQALLLTAAKELAIPVVITEQYPKGLGRTAPELFGIFAPSWPLVEKTSFSCFGTAAFKTELSRKTLSSVILLGIETHVCVQQTALDALNSGLGVFVPADAVCSRNSAEKDTALALMSSSGAVVSTAESIIFMLLRDASHPSFRNISKLLR